MSLWIEKKWKPLMKGCVSHAFHGKIFFIYLFEVKEYFDLIFKRGMYFMGTRGMYLNRWTLELSLDEDISNVIPIWVHLKQHHFHYWVEDTLRSIRSLLGKYIDKEYPVD
jgi:hypothetical protein